MTDIPKRFMERVDIIIENNIQNEYFSIENLHRELALSYAHTYRKIKEATGLTPSVYIRIKRLERACFLLKNTDLNITEIADKVGFNTHNYFSKCFSIHFGCTPKAFRRID